MVNAGSAAALWAELDSASRRDAPIVLFNWTPNFIEAVYEGAFIEFPEYHEKCREDPSWGMTRIWRTTAATRRTAISKSASGKGFPESHPGAYEIVRKMNFTNLDIAVMAKLADIDGMEPEDAADKWLAGQRSQVESWMN